VLKPALLGLGFVLVVVQVAVSTTSGISHARAFDHTLETGSQLVVNLDRVPVAARSCYSLYGVFVYLYPVPGQFRYVGFDEARSDALSMFSPGLRQMYRNKGLPDIPQCQPR
jgi:hypothetical protein